MFECVLLDSLSCCGPGSPLGGAPPDGAKGSAPLSPAAAPVGFPASRRVCQLLGAVVRARRTGANSSGANRGWIQLDNRGVRKGDALSAATLELEAAPKAPPNVLLEVPPKAQLVSPSWRHRSEAWPARASRAASARSLAVSESSSLILLRSQEGSGGCSRNAAARWLRALVAAQPPLRPLRSRGCDRRPGGPAVASNGLETRATQCRGVKAMTGSARAVPAPRCERGAASSRGDCSSSRA